jgi:hypothetical protein
MPGGMKSCPSVCIFISGVIFAVSPKSMSDMGNSGARSSGFTGWCVPGWSTAAGGVGRSGMMLYQWRGICSSDSRYFIGMAGPPG